MEISLSLSLTGRLLSSSPATALFSVPGSRGFFYDFSDYSTQFTDTAGTTPVTGVGQSVGLVLDESRGLALGPELVTNGDFSGGATGWSVSAPGTNTITISGGSVRFVANGSADTASLFQPWSGATAVGKYYRITFDVLPGSTGTLKISTLGINSVIGEHSFLATPGAKSFTLVSANVSTIGIARVVGSSADATIDNISVRELPGNHATQATAGSRALTQVRPMFTQRNRAVGSELPENATYWPASSTVNGITITKVASGTGTDGLPYVDYTVSGTASSSAVMGFNVSSFSRTAAAPGQTWTGSVLAQIIAGSPPPSASGLRIDLTGETAPSTSTENITGTLFRGTTETLVSSSITLANGATNQVRVDVTSRTETGATVNYTIRIKGLMFELGSARTTYQPAVSGELRNLMFTSGNPLLWVGTGTTNGITINRIATGVDAAGLPYADYSVSGTATAADFRLLVGGPSTRPAIVGQTFTSSVYVQRIAGTAPPAGCGAYTEVIELGAGGTFLDGTASIPQDAPTLETFRTITRTLSNASLVDVRGGVVITTASGATVNYTVRIKASQFEQASTYSRYQRTITANEWYEPGFTSYRGIRFDGSDDFLQTAAIDFAGAESLGPELVTNGDFSVGTGWTLGTGVTISGGVANLAAGSLYLEQGITTVAGRSYKVTATASNGAFCGAWDLANQNNLLSGSATTRTGTFSFTFTANDTQSFIAFTASGAGATTIDNVSVREVLIPADKMTVVAGVRKLSDAAVSIVTELTVNSNTENGSFYLTAPQTVAANFGFASKGTIQAVPTGSGFPAPLTAVQTGVGDISGDVATLRINGSQAAQLTSDQGTGNYANAAVYIGRRAGSSLPFNGIITFLCVINRTLTASELAQLEAFANSRTGAY